MTVYLDKYTKPDWQKSALLTIDVQEDFSRSDSEVFIPGTEDIIPNLVSLANYYRDHHRPVYHIIRLYSASGLNVDLCRRLKIEEGKEIVAPGKVGSELIRELKPTPAMEFDSNKLLNGEPQEVDKKEWILYKPRWGAFYQTPLEKMLREQHINTIVIAGCNFPNCPRTTVYEASERDFRIVLVSDAVSGIYRKGEQELKNIGVSILKTGDIIARRNHQQRK